MFLAYSQLLPGQTNTLSAIKEITYRKDHRMFKIHFIMWYNAYMYGDICRDVSLMYRST